MPGNNLWQALSSTSIPRPSAHPSVREDRYATPYILICPICYLKDDKKVELKVKIHPVYKEVVNPNRTERDIVVDYQEFNTVCHQCKSSLRNLSKRLFQEKHE